jgi:RNA polymerase sigma-70 factor (ECF subfamily)
MTKREKNKAWFTGQIEENLDSLYGAALRLTRNRVNAEDLVADTVLNAWSSIESLEDRGRFRPWIFRILRNRFISDCRRKAVRPKQTNYEDLFGVDESYEISTFIMDQPDNFQNWWANPEKDYVNKLLGEQLRAAIDSLPAAFRTVVLLINVDELGYDETAAVLGIPTGTVRSRMKRGRTLLQKKLWQLACEEGVATHLTGAHK